MFSVQPIENADNRKDTPSSLCERLQDAYDKVAFWPERSPHGINDLLHLRNLIPEAIAALRADRAEIMALRERL